MSSAPVRLAWAGGALALGLMAAAVVFVGLTADPAENLGTPWLLVWLLIWPGFALVGARIGISQPGNRLAWLLLAVGLLGATWTVAISYVQFSLTRPVGLPGVEAAVWIVAWASGPMFPGVFVLLPLLFPDGKLPDRRWRVVLWLGLVGLALSTISGAVQPGPVDNLPLDNPLGIDALAGPTRLIWEFGSIVMLPLVVAALASLVARFRRAGPVERHQITWIVAAIGLMIAITSVSQLLMVVVDEDWDRDAESLMSFVQLAPVLLVPLAIGVAVTRYRLYEIDRIISRTVTYGLVTTVLISIYALVATVPAALFDLQSDLLVAGATLVAAAAFGPVRRRIQALVDRRFNRSRYDAGQVMDRFAGRLQQELDLDELTTDLRGVVTHTVQPAHLSLWLREPEAAP